MYKVSIGSKRYADSGVEDVRLPGLTHSMASGATQSINNQARSATSLGCGESTHSNAVSKWISPLRTVRTIFSGRHRIAKDKTKLRTKFAIREKMQSKRTPEFDSEECVSTSFPIKTIDVSNHEWIEPDIRSSYCYSASKRLIWKTNRTTDDIHMNNYDVLCGEEGDIYEPDSTPHHITYIKQKFNVSYFDLNCPIQIVRHSNNTCVLHKFKNGKWIMMGQMSLDISGYLCIDDYVTPYMWIEDLDSGSKYDYISNYERSDGGGRLIPTLSSPDSASFVYKHRERRRLVSVEDQSACFEAERAFLLYVKEYTQNIGDTPITEAMLAVGRICREMYLISHAPDPTYCFFLITLVLDNFMSQYNCNSVDVMTIRKEITSSIDSLCRQVGGFTNLFQDDNDPTAHSTENSASGSVPKNHSSSKGKSRKFRRKKSVVEDQSAQFSPLMKFQSLLTGPLLGHLDTLACFLVTLGFVQPSCIRIKPFEDYRIQCKAKTTTLPSFIERIVTSAEYLWSASCKCFETRSFDPLFGSSDALTALQEEYAHVKNNIDLVLNGTYESITKKTVWDYDQDLASIEKQIQLLKMNVNNTSQLTSLLTIMAGHISSLQQRVLAHKQSMGTRMEPFAIKLFGGSSVGKSVITEHAVRAVLSANGIGCSPAHIITIDLSDQYDSNFRGDATCYIADDLANAHASFEVVDSSNLVIRMVNSVQSMAIMPQAQDKGRVPIAPFMFIATTNRQNLNAIETSTTPSSVLRRFHIHATVRVKERFATPDGMLDKSRIHEAPKFEGVMPDLQLIDVTIPDFSCPLLRHYPLPTPDWFKCHWTKPTLTGLNLKQFLLYACELSKRHKASETVRMGMRDTVQNNPMCERCKLLEWVCPCVKDQTGFLDPITLQVVARGANFGLGFIYDTLKSTVNTTIQRLFPTPAEYVELRALEKVKLIQKYLGLHGCTHEMRWWDLVPSVLIKNNPWFDRLYDHIERDTAMLYTLRQARVFGFALSTTVLLPRSYRTISYGTREYTVSRSLLAGASTVFIGAFTCVVHKYNKKMVAKALEDRKIDAEAVLEQAMISEDSKLYRVLRYASVGALISASLLALRLALRTFSEQSMLHPTTEDEFVARATTPNMWVKKTFTPPESGTSSPDDVCNIVSKNIMSMKYTVEGLKPMYCNCLIVDSNHILMNKHVWYYAMRDGVLKPDITGDIVDAIEFEFIRGENLHHGDSYSRKYHKSQVKSLGSGDVVLVCNTVNGPRKSLFPYFIKEIEYATYAQPQPVIFLQRDLTGKKQRFRATTEKHHLRYPRANGDAIWEGFRSTTDHDWGYGDCGTVCVSHSLPPRILGIHAIGISDMLTRMIGCSVLVTQEMLSPYLSGELDITPLDTLPDVVCGQTIDMSRSVPDVHFIKQGSFNQRFEILGYRPTIASYCSKVTETSLVDSLIAHGHGDNQWKGPQMFFKSPWLPFKTYFDKVMDPMRDLPYDLLKAAQKDYVEGFVNGIKNHQNPQKVLEHFYPLTNHEILNGRRGAKYMEGMAMSTSTCFPFTGKKKDKLVDLKVDANGQEYYVLKPTMEYLWTEMAEYEEQLAKGIECFFPFVSQQKDEIVPKIRKGVPNAKVRVFQSSSLMLSFLMRKYFLPLVRLFAMFPLLSECLVGLNPYGPEFTEVFHRLIIFGIKRLLDGDYGGWDQKVSDQLGETAYDGFIMMVEQLCEVCPGKYSPRDIKIMKVLKYAVIHAIIIIHGAIIRIHGTNPSGNTITTHTNSSMNSILLRVAVYSVHPELIGKDFRSYVAAVTYGDDLCSGVSDGLNFNFSVMSTFLKSYNMEFTTGKKQTGDNIQFMAIDEISFLKRSFVYHPKINCVLGALDINSMYKCLYNWVKKKGVTELQVMTSNFQMFAQELFAHGERHYNLMIPHIKQVANENGIFLAILDETYEQRARDWFMLYKPKEIYADYCQMEDLRARRWTEIQTSPPEALYRFPWVGVPKELKPGIINLLKQWFNTAIETSDGFTGVELDDISSLNVDDQSAVVHVEEADQTIQKYDRLGMNFPSTYAGRVDIQQYLSRPVRIRTINWTPNTPVNVTFNPLDAFLGNRAVARKVANYRYISGVMHFKVITTGTMSHWGRLIAAIEPWPLLQSRSGAGANPPNPGPIPSLRQCYHLQHVMVDPTSELGGEMSMQIFSPFDNKITIADSALTKETCIRMYVQDMAPLKVLNSGTTGITVQIFMHMTDVVLTGAVTDTPVPVPDVLPAVVIDQSGEYPSGIISAPASLAADALDVIGEGFKVEKYTNPLSSGLRTTSKVASLLGYSAPNSAEPPLLVARRTFNPLATTNSNVTIEKLSLDVKQAVNTDPISSGIIESDPMMVSYIASKDHLTRTVAWRTADSAQTVLYRLAVTPQQDVTGNSAQMSPAMWLAAPFEYFRGTMIVRIEIVGSAFHRGKLRVVYDPTRLLIDPGPTGVQFDNENYSQVVDITESRSYEFCIGWNTNFPWLLNPEPVTQKTDQLGPLNTGTNWVSERRHNGVMAITVEAPLTVGATAPTSGSSDAVILVYTRWDKDFSVASPRASIRQLSYIDQSGDLGSTPSSIRAEHQLLCLNEVDEELDTDNKIHSSTVGERIYSIRQIIKRPTFHGVYNFNKGSQPLRYRYRFCDFPVYRGTSQLSQPTSTGTGARVLMTLLNWYARPYMGYTGSTRWRYLVYPMTASVQYPYWAAVTRANKFSSYQEEAIIMNDTNQVTNRSLIHNSLSTFIAGSTLMHSDHNRVLEADLPYVYDGRYKICFTDKTEDNNVEGSVGDETWHFLEVFTPHPVGVTYFVNSYVSAGDDMSFYHFRYIPRVENSGPISHV